MQINSKIFIKKDTILQAILVGLIAGLLVVLFKISISSIFSFIQNFLNKFSLIQKILIFPIITAVGGFISGYLVYKFAPEAKGSGIPYVKATLMRLGNLTRIRSIFVKFFGGICSIGTGMSLGREGPSVQLGAGAGALIGKIFKLSGTSKNRLIASGAGSAIGATFNAPISGTIFVLEELMQDFNSSILFPTLIATVCASSLARHLLGNQTTFLIPKVLGEIKLNIFVCLTIGIISGVLGVIFSKLIHQNNNLFSNIKIKSYYKTAIAGFIVGIIGIFLPLILGSGNIAVDVLLSHKISISLVLLIFIFKFLITPFCFGSGAVGGIFLPMLMLGAYLGYFIGGVYNYFGIETNLIISALLGMAAFLSSVARTPLTATVMVFEMTGGYNFILPIMFCCAISDAIAKKLKHEPIYSELILNQIKTTKYLKVLENTLIKDVVRKDTHKFLENDDILEVLNYMNKNNYDSCPIVDNNNFLLGSINKSDIEDYIINLPNSSITVKEIMNPKPTVCQIDSNLYNLYLKLHLNNEKVFIIDNENKLVGTISREDMKQLIFD